MKIIPFPGSGLTKRGNSSENYRMDNNRPLYLNRKKSGSDIIDISAEAKNKFQQEKIVKLDKAKMLKEARDYYNVLNSELQFADSDARRSVRGEKIAEARLKMDSGFYSNMENNIIKIIAEKILI